MSAVDTPELNDSAQQIHRPMPTHRPRPPPVSRQGSSSRPGEQPVSARTSAAGARPAARTVGRSTLH